MSAPEIINPGAASGGIPVGGSGTPNTLPIWSGSTTLSNSAVSQVEGCIATVAITNAGAGGTAGNYKGLALTNITGTGTGTTADITIVGGVVTLIAIRLPGIGYTVGDTLSVVVGALAGAVFTVTAIAPSDNAAGNITAQRIASGSTSAPQGLSTSLGFTSSRSFWQVEISPNTGNALQARTCVAINSEDEPTGFFRIPVTESGTSTGFRLTNRFDFRERVGNYTVGGIQSAPAIWYQNATGSSFLNGGNFQAAAAGPNLSAALLNLIGVFSLAVVQSNVTNPNTISTLYAHDCIVSCSATGIQSIPNAGYIVPRSAIFSGAAHAIGQWYGLWLPAPTLSTGSTITNRYNVAQDDVNGKNNFRSKVFVGTALAATQQTAASLELEATNTILSGTITNAGSAYTDGTYTNQTLTGGAPTVAARANIVVSGGVVTSVTLIVGGEGYAVGNVLSCAIPGGAGFQWTVSTIQGNGDVRLRSNSAVFDASNSSTNGLKLFNRAGTGQTSSTLSWYEEGSYTPTFSAAWTPGSYTATWTRIGRKVFVTINFASGTTNGTSGAATITVPSGLTPARAGLGLRGRPDGTASGSGLVAVDTAGLIQLSTAVTLDTNAKVIQVEYEV